MSRSRDARRARDYKRHGSAARTVAADRRARIADRESIRAAGSLPLWERSVRQESARRMVPDSPDYSVITDRVVSTPTASADPRGIVRRQREDRYGARDADRRIASVATEDLRMRARLVSNGRLLSTEDRVISLARRARRLFERIGRFSPIRPDGVNRPARSYVREHDRLTRAGWREADLASMGIPPVSSKIRTIAGLTPQEDTPDPSTIRARRKAALEAEARDRREAGKRARKRHAEVWE